MYKCTQIDEYFLLAGDLDIECWKGSHARWAFGYFLPLIFIWILGLPALGIAFLTWKRHRLDEPGFKGYFLIMY